MCSGSVLRTSDGWPCQGTVNLKRLIWNLCLLRVGAASQSQHQGIARRTWWKSGNPQLQRLRVKQVLNATSDRSAFADLGEEKNKGPKGLRCCILDLWCVTFMGFWELWRLHISSFWKNWGEIMSTIYSRLKSPSLPSSMQVMGPPDGTQVCRTLLEGSIQMKHSGIHTVCQAVIGPIWFHLDLYAIWPYSNAPEMGKGPRAAPCHQHTRPMLANSPNLPQQNCS